MNEPNNFANAWKSYLINRHIREDVINSLVEQDLISYEQNKICFKMKDLDWNIVGIQQRFIQSIILDWEQKKSLVTKGGGVWYFYQKLDFSLPIIIAEWEVDWSSIAHLPNAIWLQNVAGLKKLIEWLKAKWVNVIYLLIDQDDPADIAISKLLDLDMSSLANVFDCRGLLWSHKDVNEYIVSWEEINLELIEQHKRSLKNFKLLINKLVTSNNKVDHNQFAKYIVEKFNIASVDWNIFMYNSDSNHGIWRPLSKHQFENIIMTKLESLLWWMISTFTNPDKNNIYDFVCVYAENQTLRNRLLFKWDLEVNLKDCILDSQTFQTKKYSKIDYKFQKFPYEYKIFESYQDPVVWLKFLDEILEWYNDKYNIIGFLQEFFGSLLIADTKYQKALLCYGSWANWKGVMLSIIRELLWFNNVANIWLHEINNSQNLYNLFGKLANIDSDMQQDVQLDSGIIKKIISWEPIVAKILYKQPVEYIPFARLLIACNEQPYLKTIDNSIRRRFIYLHLKNSFYGREDPDLIKKILKEIDNIFIRSVNWLSRLILRWEFVIPKELTDNLDSFIKENDTVELFLDEWIVKRNDEGKIYNSDLYPLYKFFCNDCWYKPLSQKNLNKRLRDKWFKSDPDDRDNTWRYFLWLCKNQPF